MAEVIRFGIVTFSDVARTVLALGRPGPGRVDAQGGGRGPDLVRGGVRPPAPGHRGRLPRRPGGGGALVPPGCAVRFRRAPDRPRRTLAGGPSPAGRPRPGGGTPTSSPLVSAKPSPRSWPRWRRTSPTGPMWRPRAPLLGRGARTHGRAGPVDRQLVGQRVYRAHPSSSPLNYPTCKRSRWTNWNDPGVGAARSGASRSRPWAHRCPSGRSRRRRPANYRADGGQSADFVVLGLPRWPVRRTAWPAGAARTPTPGPSPARAAWA